jgi:hypothetical protein
LHYFHNIAYLKPALNHSVAGVRPRGLKALAPGYLPAPLRGLHTRGH